ncbi:hypothetical protein [Flavobacterium sp.]|jgi:hypothetical protein|uniref:hypothetical protein n=1 Tax=Flavobacterium sp. TaxID=239 RepID=UPI0037C18B9B
MKSKTLNFLLIIFSLIGYLEWSGNQYIFLFEAEIEIFSKLFTSPISVLHPFIILPIISQFLLLFTLFQKKPSKKLTYISIFGLGILFVFMLFIGIISLNYKIALSTIPFILVSLVTMLHHRKFNE